MAVKCALLWIFFSLSDAAITSTPNSISECDGRSVSLKWVYDVLDIVVVEWKFNGNLMLQYVPSQPPGSQYTYSNGYSSAKVAHISNGEINITSLTTSDSGNYSCKTTYSSGSPNIYEIQMTLTVSDMISTNLICSYNQSTGIIDCSAIPSSITSVTINGAVYITSSFPTNVADSKTYKVCMAGDASECLNDGIQPCITLEGKKSPISQITTSIATDRTSVNNSIQFSNMNIPNITGSVTPTSDISASATGYFNTETTNFYPHTESTNVYSNIETKNFYTKTETATSYANTETTHFDANSQVTHFKANIETTNFDATTETSEIQTETTGIISFAVSPYHSMFVQTVANDISGPFDTTSQTMTESFTLSGFSISSHDEITIPSSFESSSVLPQFFPETSISLSLDRLSGTFFHTPHVSSGSLITTDSRKYSILSMTISPSYVDDMYIFPFSTLCSVPSDTTESANRFSLTIETVQTSITTATIHSSPVNTVLNSEKSESLRLCISGNNSCIQEISINTESPFMSTSSVIDLILYSSKREESSFSSFQYLSEIIVTLTNNSIASRLPSSVIDKMQHVMNITHILSTSYQDDTQISIDDLTIRFQSSQDYAASVSTSFGKLINDQLPLQTTEYHVTMQTEFTSYVTKSLYESNTNTAAKEVYSSEIVSSIQSNMYISAMSSETQTGSLNDIHDSQTYFRSNTIEPYSQSTNAVFSSEMSDNILSTFQSTNFLLSFKTNSNVYRVDSSLKTTNMLIFGTQSSMLTISAVLSDFETTRLTTTIKFNNETIPSMIKPSSQQKNPDNSCIEIDTSFKDSLFSSSLFPGSLTSNYPVMSSSVFESISTSSTSTVQSVLSEKNKIIIVISTTSAVVTIVIVILLIIFARMNMSKHNKKPRNEDDNISWSNSGIHSKTIFHDYSFTGKSIYPFVNTSSSSVKMYPYEHNWNDIV